MPRHRAGPKNADATLYDLGLCAREKAATHELSDLQIRLPRHCGLFKTPTLRNVERTAPCFHNAGMASLTDAVRCHVERDTASPERYRQADASADRRYNDLPW